MEAGLRGVCGPLGGLGVQVKRVPGIPAFPGQPCLLDSWAHRVCSARVAGRPLREILCCFCPQLLSIKMVSRDNSQGLRRFSARCHVSGSVCVGVRTGVCTHTCIHLHQDAPCTPLSAPHHTQPPRPPLLQGTRLTLLSLHSYRSLRKTSRYTLFLSPNLKSHGRKPIGSN